MDYKNKATLEKKKRNTGYATIAFLGCIGCAALGLTVYSLIIGKFLFALAYIVAFILSAIYTIMKINTVIPSYIASDDETIYLSVWENDFFPYKLDQGFWGEFIPEKVKMVEVPMSDISKIHIGSGNFITRNLPESSFSANYKEHKTRFASVLKRMEFFHIELKDGSECYMPITDFDPASLGAIVKDAKAKSPLLSFTTGNRKVRRYVPEPDRRF